MGAEELTIGSIGISVVLSIILKLIYGSFTIGNKIKPWIAVILGMGLGVLAMFYIGEPVIFKSIVDYIIRGFMTGATAVGLYEMAKK